MSALRLVVSGRVQGVGYRAFAVETARALGIDGWVRNRRDGTVEILIDALAPHVERFVDACRQGPPLADVKSIARERSGEAVPRGFTERPTA